MQREYLVKSRQKLKAFLGMAAATILVSASFVLPTFAPAASADPIVPAAVVPDTGPITVPICQGTTSFGDGEMNTPSPFVLPDNSVVANELRAGKTIMLYGNQGYTYVDAAGTHSDNGQGGLPYCGARMLDDGELEVDWRFCTDEGKSGCADQPPSSEWTGTPQNPLTDEQKHQIAYILMDPPLSTKRERAITQLQVWCVSESIAEGSVNEEAFGYFNYNDFQGSVTSSNPENRKLSQDEARCNYLPDLTSNPELSIAGPTDVVAAGTPAQFTVTTNITTPITLSTTSSAPIQLCPVEQNGVTFDGEILQLSAPGTATLCVTSAISQEFSLTADSGDLPEIGELGLLWNGDRGCQVFADYIQGNKLRIAQTVDVSVSGEGSFEVSKDFSGVPTTAGDLDDVQVTVDYTVTSWGSLASDAPAAGTLVLNEANGFSATGPTYSDGTVISLVEGSVTGLPASLEQESITWSVDGVPSTGNSANVTVGDGSVMQASLSNEIAQVQGTFEVRKSFEFENGIPNLPAGTEVEVMWWVQGTTKNPNQTLLLNEANGFIAQPGTDPSNPTLFPLGTSILLEEIEQPLPNGVADIIDWGSNTYPADDGASNRGIVTIAEAWIPTAPGGGEVAEVALTNGLSLDRGSLTVSKRISSPTAGADQPVLGQGDFDDAEFTVRASWTHPDPLLQSSGSNVILLNQSNGWASGIGVDLAVGTVVTLDEIDAFSTNPSVSWEDEPLWTCANCSPPFTDDPGANQVVTIPAATVAGEPVPDLSIGLTNTYEILTGGLLLEKRVAGDIDRDDPRLEGVEFTVNWESTDAVNAAGTMVLRGPDWTAQPQDDNGQALNFPLGTVVTLEEAVPAQIPGLVWGDDLQWSLGDEGTDASITITSVDQNDDPAASLTLTNYADLHEGSFSIAKMVHSVDPVDTDGVSFSVNYRSVDADPSYEGSIAVENSKEGFSEAFPAGTQLVLEEILPDPLANTVGWEEPVFVDSAGNILEAPVMITIGDGTDIRVDVINTTIHPDEPVVPGEPTRPELPVTGSQSTAVMLVLGALLVLSGVVATTALARRRAQ